MHIDPDIQTLVEGQLANLSPEQARAEIQLLIASPEFWAKKDNPASPSFKHANCAWERLHQIGFPDDAD